MIRTLIKEELTEILSMIHKARRKERDFRGSADIRNISMEYRNPCKYYDIA